MFIGSPFGFAADLACESILIPLDHPLRVQIRELQSDYEREQAAHEQILVAVQRAQDLNTALQRQLAFREKALYGWLAKPLNGNLKSLIEFQQSRKQLQETLMTKNSSEAAKLKANTAVTDAVFDWLKENDPYMQELLAQLETTDRLLKIGNECLDLAKTTSQNVEAVMLGKSFILWGGGKLADLAAKSDRKKAVANIDKIKSLLDELKVNPESNAFDLDISPLFKIVDLLDSGLHLGAIAAIIKLGQANGKLKDLATQLKGFNDGLLAARRELVRWIYARTATVRKDLINVPGAF